MKKVLILFLILLIATIGFGCASNDEAQEAPMMAKSEAREYSDENMAVEMDMAAGEMYEEEVMAEEPAPFDGADAGSIEMQTNRKLIYYFDFQIETTNFDKDYDFILNQVSASKGYVQNASTRGTKPDEYYDEGRYANLNLRIPIKNYEAFVASLEGVGNILYKSQTTDDVSARYFDTEARVRILKTKIDRLEDLLEKADDLKDVITLEQELSNAIYDLDKYEGQIRQLDNLIDYTTVTISLDEVNEIKTISQEEAGLGQRISDAFSNMVNGLVRFFEGLIIVIIGGLPLWILLGVIVFIVLKITKRRKAKKAKRVSELVDKVKEDK